MSNRVLIRTVPGESTHQIQLLIGIEQMQYNATFPAMFVACSLKFYMNFVWMMNTVRAWEQDINVAIEIEWWSYHLAGVQISQDGQVLEDDLQLPARDSP